MIQHEKKGLKKIFTLFITICLLFTSVFAFSGCESSHPNANVTLSFDGTDGVKTYTLKYKLYRNIYPQTVKRFIELADADFYDGLVVHNYDSSKLATGAYYYADKDDSYEEIVAKDLPDTLTQSVFTKDNAPLNSVYGEFTKNGFSVKNDGVNWDFGNLYFNYDDAIYAGQVLVNVTNSNNQPAEKDYKNNAATSQFAINLNEAATADDTKCCFAEITNSSELTDLVAYINLYIESMKEDNSSYSLTETVTKTIYQDDLYADEYEISYKVPVQRITIKSVEVTKH